MINDNALLASSVVLALIDTWWRSSLVILNVSSAGNHVEPLRGSSFLLCARDFRYHAAAAPCSSRTMQWPHLAMAARCSGRTLQWSHHAVVAPCSGRTMQWPHHAMVTPCSGRTMQWRHHAVAAPYSGRTMQWPYHAVAAPMQVHI